MRGVVYDAVFSVFCIIFDVYVAMCDALMSTNNIHSGFLAVQPDPIHHLSSKAYRYHEDRSVIVPFPDEITSNADYDHRRGPRRYTKLSFDTRAQCKPCTNAIIEEIGFSPIFPHGR